MLEARTIGVSVNREWRSVYDAIWRPEDFSRWASGLAKTPIERDGEHWKAEGPEGPIRIRFTDHNPFGVMDHWVDVGAGRDVYVPMRVVANQSGAEILFTLFRQPEMSEAQFAADAEWVARDLAALKRLLAGGVALA